SGAWPVHPGRLTYPPPSATGLDLCALGSVRPDSEVPPSPDGEVRLWEVFHAETGGDFSGAAGRGAQLPPLASVYLEAGPAGSLAERLACGEALHQALPVQLRTDHHR